MPTTPPKPTASPAGQRRPHHALGLQALYDLHQHRYRDYADLLLAPTDADLALRATQDYLTSEWAHAVGTANPRAFAWQALRHRVCLLAGPGPLRPLAHLTPRQQDIVLLHHALALRAEEVANLTGTEAAAVYAEILAIAHSRHGA
ncbi:hypothetical protein ACFVUY_42020 [Kitasatospora sp. NPDC058063]|uniref:hypothetical protein n=1 Tax=unclassified Kitasatospora TaxID=2633591 RepID=UPI0036DAA577